VCTTFSVCKIINLKLFFVNIFILIATKIVTIHFNKTGNKQDNKKQTVNYYDSFILIQFTMQISMNTICTIMIFQVTTIFVLSSYFFAILCIFQFSVCAEIHNLCMCVCVCARAHTHTHTHTHTELRRNTACTVCAATSQQQITGMFSLVH